MDRLFQTYSRTAGLFEVKIEQRADPERKSKGKGTLSVLVRRHEQRGQWAELAEGCYLLRTNLQGRSATELRQAHIGLRPIYHHKQDRTQAHILVCFLALVMWRTLQHWMQTWGLGTAPRKLLEEMAEVRSLDVVLPTRTGREIRLWTVSRPENTSRFCSSVWGFHCRTDPKEFKM